MLVNQIPLVFCQIYDYGNNGVQTDKEVVHFAIMTKPANCTMYICVDQDMYATSYFL